MNYTNNIEEAEKIEKIRNKILKYILYKKRTEQEVRIKFSDVDENLLEDAIEYFKELNYINDEEYVNKAIKEFTMLKKMSIKELEYKICQKGINKSIVDDYILNNKDKLLDYEISSAKSIIMKKTNNLEKKEIKEYLLKKGYMAESINIAFDEIS